MVIAAPAPPALANASSSVGSRGPPVSASRPDPVLIKAVTKATPAPGGELNEGDCVDVGVEAADWDPVCERDCNCEPLIVSEWDALWEPEVERY